jgi:hypothetical protein
MNLGWAEWSMFRAAAVHAGTRNCENRPRGDAAHAATGQKD